MTMPTPSIAIPRAPRRPGRRTVIGLAAGAALAVAAGVGLWEANRGGDATMAGEQAPSAVVAAPAARVRPADAIITVSIVDSQEEKLRLERGLDEGTALHAQLGERPLANQVVLVAATTEEAVRLMELYSGYQNVLGQPVTFNDFRARAAAPAAAPVAVETLGGTAEPYREQAGAVLRYVYLVGSEDAATAIRQLAAGADQVHVVETEADASQVQAGLSGPGTTFIDLRTPAAGARGACGTDFEPASC